MNTLEINKKIVQILYFIILLSIIFKNAKCFVPEIKSNVIPFEKPIKSLSKHINDFGCSVSNNLTFQFKKINKYIIIFILSLLLSVVVFIMTYKFVKYIRNIYFYNDNTKNIEIKIKNKKKTIKNKKGLRSTNENNPQEKKDTELQGVDTKVQDKKDKELHGVDTKVQDKKDKELQGVDTKVQDKKDKELHGVDTKVQEKKDTELHGVDTKVQEKKDTELHGVDTKVQEKKDTELHGVDTKVQEKKDQELQDQELQGK